MLQPLPPPPKQLALHPLTGTPPRRGGGGKGLSLSPLNRRALSTVSSSSGLPQPPSSPRPEKTAAELQAEQAEQEELE